VGFVVRVNTPEERKPKQPWLPDHSFLAIGH